MTSSGGGPAFGDSPNYQGLAPRHVAAGEYAGDAGHLVLVHLHVAAPVQRHAQVGKHALVFGVQETHGQQDQVRLHLHLAAGDFIHDEAAVLSGSPVNPNRLEFLYLAVAARERLGEDVVVADATFFVGRR